MRPEHPKPTDRAGRKDGISARTGSPRKDARTQTKGRRTGSKDGVKGRGQRTGSKDERTKGRGHEDGVTKDGVRSDITTGRKDGVRSDITTEKQ